MSSPATKSSSGKALLSTLVSLAISVGLLAAIILWKEIRLEDLTRILQAADKGICALAFLISTIFHIVFGSHKLYLVLRTLDMKITFRDTVRVVLGIGPLQLLLPLKGGEVAAVLYFWRYRKMPLGRASSALIFDRSLNFVAAGVFLLAGILLQPGGGPDLQSNLLLGTSALFAIALFASPLHDLALDIAGRLHPRLERFARAILEPWRKMGLLKKLFFLGYGLVVVIRPVFVCHLLFMAFDVPAPPALVLLYSAAAIFAGHLPGPLMGLGAREAALVGISSQAAGGGETVALGIGLLLSLIVYVGPMLLGLPWVPSLMRGIIKGREASGRAPSQDEAEGEDLIG